MARTKPELRPCGIGRRITLERLGSQRNPYRSSLDRRDKCDTAVVITQFTTFCNLLRRRDTLGFPWAYAPL